MIGPRKLWEFVARAGVVQHGFDRGATLDMPQSQGGRVPGKRLRQLGQIVFGGPGMTGNPRGDGFLQGVRHPCMAWRAHGLRGRHIRLERIHLDFERDDGFAHIAMKCFANRVEIKKDGVGTAFCVRIVAAGVERVARGKRVEKSATRQPKGPGAFARRGKQRAVAKRYDSL